MNVVFCADRAVLPGLHVALYSLLNRITSASGPHRISIFSDALDGHDMALIQRTVAPIKKPFSLELRRVDPAAFARFPPLNGSWSTYYRLWASQVMDVDRFLYVDADTLCDVDVSQLQSLDMGKAPAGWVPEAPLPLAVDRGVARQLGNSDTDAYFNAGVMLVNVLEWRRQQITEKAMEYIAAHRPAFHDQSALNCVLYRKAMALPETFNCMANMRKNWPALAKPLVGRGKLVHFLDYPKPWDFLAEWVHPQYRLWRAVLDQTAMSDFRSWQQTPARKFPRTQKALAGYRKSAKDHILFAAYSAGWIQRVKGVGSKNAEAQSKQPSLQ